MMRRVLHLGWRQLLLLSAMLAFSAMIARNLVYWQVTAHARVTHEAQQIYSTPNLIPAQRGSIVSADGHELVGEVPTKLVWADPWVIQDRRLTADKLAPLLKMDRAQLYNLLAPRRYADGQRKEYVPLARQVDMSVAQKIEDLGLTGIVLDPTWRADYPAGPLAAPILGFVDGQNNGQYGLEGWYNKVLQGQPGIEYQATDTAHHQLTVGAARPHPPVDGATLQLTIDSRIQQVVEKRLAMAVNRYHADHGMAIVMDPHTGAILAMASLPSYDPNHYDQVSDYRLFSNWALTNYQPGSTFKVVSVAAGLDSGKFTPSTQVYDPGIFRKYGMTVHNWEIDKGWGWETPQIMLRWSANVGMAQFADMMGPDVFYRYVTQNFGFGSPTGIDLPEESGLVRTPASGPTNPWSPMDLLTNSYGQGIDVTPLQLTDAVAALANGGLRVRPYIVQKIINPDNTIRWQAHTKVVTRAVSAQTAATITDILKNSAIDGEATCALTKDYPVAAKTGTATIDVPAAHGMSMDKGTIASLIGYAPADNPRFVMLVSVYHPNAGPDNIWGSVVAAPAWHDIAVQLYTLMHIAPEPGSTQLPAGSRYTDLDQMQGPTGWNCQFMHP